MTTESDRISIDYHPPSRFEIEQNSWMLMDDLCKNIVPSYSRKNETVQCTLVPAENDFQALLCDLLPHQHSHSKKDFKNVILSVIDFLAQGLVYDGRIVLELVSYKVVGNDNHYKLVKVSGEEFKIKGNLILQTVNDEVANQLNCQKSVAIPIEKCFIIEFPESLGGTDSYLKFLQDFRELGEQNPMRCFLASSKKEIPGYDVMEHQRMYEIELFRKSKLFQWHHRGNNNKLFSGYYEIFRRLQFRKSQLVLRDYIVEKLCEIVTKLSIRFGNKTVLKIEGLMQSEKVDKAIEKWKTGILKTDKISDVLF